MDLVSKISSSISSVQQVFDFSVWKEVLLITAVALTAIATISQIFGGSFWSCSFFAILWAATYIGYEANQTVKDLEIREKYYQTLRTTTEALTKQCEKFSLENKIMAQNNEDLERQVEQLTSQVQEMRNLLTQLELAASLTQNLLTSCIDVSSDQRQTEARIHQIVERLERQVGRQESELSRSLDQMALQIKQFFLEESRGELLLEIKKEFLETTQALQAVQKELAETSRRLKKTSQKIEKKTQTLVKEQDKLAYLRGLAPRVLLMIQNQSISQKLSLADKQNAKNLQSYYQSGADLFA